MLLRARAVQVRRHLSNKHAVTSPTDSVRRTRGVAYDLAVDVVVTAAVGGGECGRALLQVPRLGVVFRHAAHGQREDTVGVAVARARVLRTSAVA